MSTAKIAAQTLCGRAHLLGSLGTQNVCLATMEGDIGGVHWTALRELLPLYQAITTVAIGDGRSTSFWYDVWCGDD